MQARLVGIMLIFAVYGCSTVIDYSVQSNEYLFNAGVEFMDDGKYTRATEMFRYIILSADNPDNAQAAQKLMADAYFLNDQFPEAIAAYEIYYEMYRQSPNLPYIIYMLGVSHSNIARGGGRDTSNATHAIEYFDELQVRFPLQYEQYQAAAHSRLMNNLLSNYEYRVAKYYIRINEYEAAMARLVHLVNTYPSAPTEEGAYELLVESALELENGKELASSYLTELKRLYPNNDEISDLQEEIEEK